jgi:hypothetical protein
MLCLTPSGNMTVVDFSLFLDGSMSGTSSHKKNNFSKVKNHSESHPPEIITDHILMNSLLGILFMHAYT